MSRFGSGNSNSSSSSSSNDSNNTALQLSTSEQAGLSRLGLENLNEDENLSSNYHALAEFFEKKGSEPLTEIEEEGVKSILRRIQLKSAGNSPNGKLRYPVASIHAPSLNRFDSIPNTANSFMPRNGKKQKASHESSDSTPLIKYTPLYSGNTKRPLEITKFKLRKLNNLASIPTPYRPTTDLEYYQSQEDDEQLPDVDNDYESTALVKATEENGNSNLEEVTSAEEEKEMSKTASAMLSLIEPLDEEKKQENGKPQPKKPFINPYASTAARSTPRNKRPRRPVVASSLSSPSGIIKSLEQTMPESGDNNTENSNSGSASLQRKTDAAFVDKYKPARSSSLRKSLDLTADEGGSSPRVSMISTTIIDTQQPKFTARWSAPEFADEEDDEGDVKLDDAPKSSSSPQSAKAPLFSFSKPKESAAEGKPAAPLFTFGDNKKTEEEKKDDSEPPNKASTSLFSFGGATTDKPAKPLFETGIGAATTAAITPTITLGSNNSTASRTPAATSKPLFPTTSSSKPLFSTGSTTQAPAFKFEGPAIVSGNAGFSAAPAVATPTLSTSTTVPTTSPIRPAGSPVKFSFQGAPVSGPNSGGFNFGVNGSNSSSSSNTGAPIFKFTANGGGINGNSAVAATTTTASSTGSGGFQFTGVANGSNGSNGSTTTKPFIFGVSQQQSTLATSKDNNDEESRKVASVSDSMKIDFGTVDFVTPPLGAVDEAVIQTLKETEFIF